MRIKNIPHFIKREIKYLLWAFSSRFPILPSIMFHMVRPTVWKWIGVKMGKNVSIGYGCYLDVDGASLLSIGDNVMIASECLLLLHRRDLVNYHIGVLQVDLPYIRANIIIKNNVIIGMRAVILPGVTINEGAVIAAGSVVVRDVPPYTVVGGNPAKVIREIK